MGRKELLTILQRMEWFDRTRPSFGISNQLVQSRIDQTKFAHIWIISCSEPPPPLAPLYASMFVFLIMLRLVLLSDYTLGLLKICGKHFFFHHPLAIFLWAPFLPGPHPTGRLEQEDHTWFYKALLPYTPFLSRCLDFGILLHIFDMNTMVSL